MAAWSLVVKPASEMHEGLKAAAVRVADDRIGGRGRAGKGPQCVLVDTFLGAARPRPGHSKAEKKWP